MTVRPLRVGTELDEPLERMLKQVSERLPTGGGGGIYDGMSERLTALETEFKYVRKDLDELKAGQTEIQRTLMDVSSSLTKFSAQSSIDKAEIRTELAKLPTKNDLASWKLQWTALGLAMVAIIIGGIIGGLAWIQPL